MDSTTRSGTVLRQRMIDDMRMCKLEDRTQEAYIRACAPPSAAVLQPAHAALRGRDAEESDFFPGNHNPFFWR